MSEEENNNSTNASESQDVAPTTPESTVVSQVNEAANSANNLVANLLELKDSNPKVFFGGIGGVVLLVLVFAMSGGSNSKLPVHQAKAMVPGQNYVLKSANAADPSSTVRLVSVPGSMAAYDDTEENDRDGSCKHMPQNTPVKLVQSQDAYGKKDVFAEVEMIEGECQGKRGWALSIDLQ